MATSVERPNYVRFDVDTRLPVLFAARRRRTDPASKNCTKCCNFPPEAAADVPDVATETWNALKCEGYEYEKGQYVLFTEEELAKIEPPSEQVMEIAGVCEAGRSGPAVFDASYFLRWAGMRAERRRINC